MEKKKINLTRQQIKAIKDSPKGEVPPFLKKYKAGVAQRAAAAVQDLPYQTSEGGFQSGDEAYRTSRFGRSVDALMKSRRHLKPVPKVKKKRGDRHA